MVVGAVGGGEESEQQVRLAGERLDAPVGVAQQRREVPGVGPGEPPQAACAVLLGLLYAGQDGGGERVDLQAGHLLLERGQDDRRRLLQEVGGRAHEIADAGHGRGGGSVVPGRPA